MSKSIKDYVKGIFAEIPSSEEKESLMKEIIGNLEEKVQDLVADGKDEEDAVNKAIVEFGDINDIKKEFMQKEPGKRNTAKLRLGFSILGSLLIIATLIFSNLQLTPNILWFVYPTFAVLWWPLVMFFLWLKSRSS